MPLNNAITRAIARRVARYADRVIANRDADFVVGGRDDPYLERWWILPRNRFLNAYIHVFSRSDDDRACHDHEYVSLSIVLRGDMREVYLDRGKTSDGVVVVERERPVKTGDVVWRNSKFAHRVIVVTPGAMTLFITGPRIKEWGFFCEGTRFVPWRDFVDARDKGSVGRGCE